MPGLLKVFYSPEVLFAEVKDKPRWPTPLLAAILVSLISTFLLVNVIGLETIVKAQIESNPRIAEQLGPQKIDEMARQAGESGARKALTYVSAAAGSAVSIVVVSAVLLGLLMIADAATTFSKVLSVCAYAFFAYGLVTAVLSWIVLALLSDYSGIEWGNLIPLNPTVFLDKTTTPRPLYSAASSLDLLSFWLLFLLGLGLSRVAARLPLGKAVTLVAIPWAVYVAGKAGFAALF